MRTDGPNIGTNVPAFLSKLWKMVNDPETDHLISWSPDGQSFVIQNQAKFWYSLLPIYYKHNNMSSFIRQLNMYGFHKMSSDNGGMDCDKDEIKFYHPYFQSNEPDLIKHIKRKIASSKTATSTGDEKKITNVDEITRVLVDVKQIRGKQESVDNQLASMKSENAVLWRELALLRQKHIKQQQIVNKLIQFLVTIVQPSRTGLGGLGVKRRFPLMINDGRNVKIPKTETTSDGPTIHELDTDTALTDSLLMTETNVDESNIQAQIESPADLTTPDLLDISIEDTVSTNDDSFTSDMLNVRQDLDNTELPSTPLKNSTVADLLAESELNAVASSNDEFPIEATDFQEVMNADKDIFSNVKEYINVLKEDVPIFAIPEKAMVEAGLSEVIHDITSSATSCPKTKPRQPSGEKKLIKKRDGTGKSIATRPDFKVNSGSAFFTDDLDCHLESTQDELDNIKTMLFDGYTLDTSALLGNEGKSIDDVQLQLFSPDDSYPLDVSQPSIPDDTNAIIANNYDPMLAGTKPNSSHYANTITPFEMDFDNFFDDAPDTEINDNYSIKSESTDGEINTPVILKKEPIFPSSKRTNIK